MTTDFVCLEMKTPLLFVILFWIACIGTACQTLDKNFESKKEREQEIAIAKAEAEAERKEKEKEAFVEKQRQRHAAIVNMRSGTTALLKRKGWSVWADSRQKNIFTGSVMVQGKTPKGETVIATARKCEVVGETAKMTGVFVTELGTRQLMPLSNSSVYILSIESGTLKATAEGGNFGVIPDGFF